MIEGLLQLLHGAWRADSCRRPVGALALTMRSPRALRGLIASHGQAEPVRDQTLIKKHQHGCQPALKEVVPADAVMEPSLSAVILVIDDRSSLARPICII